MLSPLGGRGHSGEADGAGEPFWPALPSQASPLLGCPQVLLSVCPPTAKVSPEAQGVEETVTAMRGVVQYISDQAPGAGQGIPALCPFLSLSKLVCLSDRRF